MMHPSVSVCVCDRWIFSRRGKPGSPPSGDHKLKVAQKHTNTHTHTDRSTVRAAAPVHPHNPQTERKR